MRKFYDAFSALRFEGDGGQAVVRFGRGDAVCLDHADGPAAEGYSRRPRRAQQSTVRRGGRRCAERRRAGFRGHYRGRRMGCHCRSRHRQRAAGRADRRGLAARQEPGYGLLGQGRRVRSHFPEHPQVADQRVARRGSRRRRAVGTHRRLRHLLQGPPLYSGPDQGPGHRRRPQPLPAGPGVLSAGSQQGIAHRLRGRVLRPGQSIAQGSVRKPARRPQVRPRGHLRAVGDRRRACRRFAQARLPAHRRRHPGGDRRAPRCDDPRPAAGAGGDDPADLQRQDRSARLPHRLPRRQPAQRCRFADRLRQAQQTESTKTMADTTPITPRTPKRRPPGRPRQERPT